jgi:predicted transcriptional regulator
MLGMTTKRQSLLKRVTELPEELLDEVEGSVEEIVQFHERTAESATAEELAGIDRGLQAYREGRFATDEEVEEILASFRSA